MALTASDYLAQEQALLPTGPAWPRDDESFPPRLLRGLAEEFSRLDARAANLFEEADPRTTQELFFGWESVAGLPDACVEAFGDEQTMAQRRAALVGRIVGVGGCSRSYLISVAEALGYAITITEFSEHNVDDDVDAPLCDEAWNFALQFNGSLNTVNELTVDDSVDEPLASWGNALLECVLQRQAQGHLTILFSYT